MLGFSPIEIAVLIIAAISVIGVIASSFRKSALFAGHENQRVEIESIASSLGLDLFRDGDDVVLAGNLNQQPLKIRFSHSEHTPGLNMIYEAPVSFAFSVVPRGEHSTEGRILIRTGDDRFDSRFSTRTDFPTQTRMFLDSKTLAHVEKLSCSARTFLTFKKGSMELSELVIPEPGAARHVLDHVSSFSALSKAAAQMPNADQIKIAPYQREKSTPALRIAIVIGAVAAMTAVVAGHDKPEVPAAPETSAVQWIPAEGILPADQPLIPGADQYRAAKFEDYDPDVRAWMNSYGLETNGRLVLDLDNDGGVEPDAAYFLIGSRGERRVVILQNGANIYDAPYKGVVAVVPVPKSAMANIEWRNRPLIPSTGDAIMIILNTEPAHTGLITYQKNGRTITGAPQSYQRVELKTPGLK